MTHPTRAFSGSIINRFTGSKILARVGQISVAFPALKEAYAKIVGLSYGQTKLKELLQFLLNKGIVVKEERGKYRLSQDTLQ